MIVDRLKRLAFRERERPTCYLHIGPDKTGTTSIQHMLRARKAALLRAGLDVPDLATSEGNRRKNHCHLAGAGSFSRPAGGALETAPDWRALSSHLKDRRGSLVLSGETFSSRMLQKPDYDEIVGFFAARGYRIVVIAYVRDQPHWLNSWFTQTQKALQWRSTFETYVARAIKNGRVDPWSYLRHPLADTGVELDVVSFEQATARGLERDFLDRIGALSVTVPEMVVPNPNIGAKGVFAAQEIIRRGGPLVERNPTRGWISKLLRKMSVERGWPQASYVGFDQAGYDAVRERYRESNDRFARRFFAADWSEICPPRIVERHVFDPISASAEDRQDVDDVVETLLRRAREPRCAGGGSAEDSGESADA